MTQLTGLSPNLAISTSPTHPGHRVQFDNFFVGRFSGTQGVCWAYITVDGYSDFAWGELHLTPLNANSRWTSGLAKRVAADLSAQGWLLEAAMTDNGSEFKAGEFDRSPFTGQPDMRDPD